MSKFIKGFSGNPKGRPKGGKNKKTLLLDALERHSPLDGRAGQVDTIVKLMFSEDMKTRKQALVTLEMWVGELC
jgi:hypothetical protein